MEYPKVVHDFACFTGRTLRFWLRSDTADYNNVCAVVVEDEYDLKKIDFAPGDVVIDVGAHIGSASMVLASLGCRVYAFEPIPENCDLLRQNAVLNELKSIHVFQGAVSGEVGRMKIHYGAECTASGRHHHFIGNPHFVPRAGFVEVDMVNLPAIFEMCGLKHCKLLKLDPEGEEEAILKSCPEAILNQISYVVGEHHFVKREAILDPLKGIFDDIPCSHQSDTELGHFWFKRKGI